MKECLTPTLYLSSLLIFIIIYLFIIFLTKDTAQHAKMLPNLNSLRITLLLLSNCVVFGVFHKFSKRNGNK